MSEYSKKYMGDLVHSNTNVHRVGSLSTEKLDKYLVKQNLKAGVILKEG